MKAGIVEQFTRAERWIVGTASLLIVILSGFAFQTFNDSIRQAADQIQKLSESVQILNHDVSKIRTEYSIVNPTEILKAVHQLDRNTMRAQEVEAIIRQSGPWLDDRPAIQMRLTALEERLRQLEIQNAKDREVAEN